MVIAANLLALLCRSIIGGAILGAGMAFGLRVSGDSGWPGAPLVIIAGIAMISAMAYLRS